MSIKTETTIFLTVSMILFLAAFAGMGQVAKSTEVKKLTRSVNGVCESICHRGFEAKVGQ